MLAVYKYTTEPDSANMNGIFKVDANDTIKLRTYASGDDTYNLDASAMFGVHFLG